MSTKIIFITTLCFTVVTTINLFGQDEPLFEKLKKNFNKEYLSIGALIQVVADFQNDRSFAGNNGFNISNFRWRIYGKLDKNFCYFLQANFIDSPTMLDAFITYQFSAAFQLTTGLFKAPFSKEFMVVAQDIDFVNRSQVVSSLAPGRQIGVQLSGWLSNEQIYYAVGAFNGNNFRINSNDNDEFLYAARLAFSPKLSSTASSKSQLEIGINMATSNDSQANIPGIYSNFRGKRNLLGADLRWTSNKLLFASEAIFGNLDRTIGDEIKPNGFHITGGFMATSNSQLLLRFDKFQIDDSVDSSDLLIFGYNLWPSKVSEFQTNYIIDLDESNFKNHQLLFNLQINFN